MAVALRPNANILLNLLGIRLDTFCVGDVGLFETLLEAFVVVSESLKGQSQLHLAID